MRKFLQLMLLSGIALIFSLETLAQEKTVTGRVFDDKNQPLVGATVKIRGTNRAVVTDATGSFSIRISKGQTLEITHVGYDPSPVKIGDSDTISLSMKTSDTSLGEVVVTAMDIKRNPKELGYSVQKLDGKEIQQTQRENFVNSLQGRIAGVTVTPTTGAAGASSSIVLRGYNSSGTNQPLFIVDGVIIDNQTIDENSNGGSTLGLASDRPNRSNDYTNRIADLNPNDIETITVLKGPEATALYGSQASSGAIVITSKKPLLNGKVAVTYDNSFRVQRLTRFPELVNTFAPGTNGNPSSTTFTAFGPAYPPLTKIYDNVHHFFKTGFAQTHNLSVGFGKKNVGFRFSGSYFDEDGVVPENSLRKVNLKVSNTTRIGKYIDITPSIAYTNAVNDKPIRGSGGYLLDLFAWPATSDVRNYLDKDGRRTFALPAADPAAESDNPLFNVHKNRGQDKTDRWIATLGIDLKPFEWLTVSGRFGYDTYKSDGYTLYSNESSTLVSIGGSDNRAYLLKGALDNYYRRYNGYSHTIYATAKKKLGSFSGRLMVGTMWQDYETKMYALVGTKLKDSTRTDSSNTDPLTRQRLLRNVFGEFNESILREMAYFGEAAISYKDLIFLSYTHRFESASVFPKKNRNYNYPGASLSVILTDVFPTLKKGNVLNFAKLRAALANTARLPDPYLNQSVFVNNFSSSTVPGFSYGFTNNNPDLSPERQRTFEIGGEFRLLKSRLLIDGSYYHTYCYNQISQNARASYATGFVLNTLNAASLRNEGVELSIDVNPVRNTDWNWNIRFNFNRTWSEVLTLPLSIGPLNDYYNSDNYIYAARGGFVRGHSTTTITGWNYVRNNAGQILILPATGLPKVTQTFYPIGDRNPDFTLGTLNNIRYKDWNLNFLWDLKVGGDIFNGTDEYLTNIGKSKRTEDRMTPRVIEGVLEDGLQNSANPTKNTIVITPYYYSTSFYGSIPEEEYIQHDVNWLRLRDITLSYLLPEKLTGRVKGLRSVSVFVTANDLVLITNYNGADPAVSATSAATRGVGSFGYDYGNLPTPIQLNVGFRANF